MLSFLIQNFSASVAEAAAVNPNGTKTFLPNGVSTFFNNGKEDVIHSLRKLRNPPSSLVTVLVVPFNEIPQFSEDLIPFMISFISLFVDIISEPLNNDEGFNFIVSKTIS